MKNHLTGIPSQDEEIIYDENDRPILIKKSTNNGTTYDLILINPDTGQKLSYYQYTQWWSNTSNSSGIFLSDRTHWVYSNNPYTLLEKISINEFGRYFKIFFKTKKIDSYLSATKYYHQHNKLNKIKTVISRVVYIKNIWVTDPKNNSVELSVVDKVYQFYDTFPQKSPYLKKFYYDNTGKLIGIKSKNQNILSSLMTFVFYPLLYLLSRMDEYSELEYYKFPFLMKQKTEQLSDVEAKYCNCWETSAVDIKDTIYRKLCRESGLVHPLVAKLNELNPSETIIDEKYFKNGKWSEFRK